MHNKGIIHFHLKPADEPNEATVKLTGTGNCFLASGHETTVRLTINHNPILTSFFFFFFTIFIVKIFKHSKTFAQHALNAIAKIQI